MKNSPDYMAQRGEFFAQLTDCSISPRRKTEQSSVGLILLGWSTAKMPRGLTNPSRIIHPNFQKLVIDYKFGDKLVGSW